MDHDEVLERLELAAVEPAGLARLAAGDTPVAAAVAAHLAGCAACAAELGRLERAAPLLRDVIRTTPPADLRERTLTFVREHGTPRGTERPAAAPLAAVSPVASPPAPVVAGSWSDPLQPTAARPLAATKGWTRLAPLVATLAAAVVFSVAATSFLVGRQLDERLGGQAQTIRGLEAVTLGTLAIDSADDAQRVALTGVDGDGTGGTLLFSPSTTRLVVVAEGLTRPPEGREYRCWIEVDGVRSSVGRMFFADQVAFWVGDTPEVSDAGPGTTFGVSLTDVGGPSLDADPIIVGQL